MKNPFNLSEEDLLKLLNGYDEWLNRDSEQRVYPVFFRKQAEQLKQDFLNLQHLDGLTDDELYNQLNSYTRNLEGKAYRTIPKNVLRNKISSLRANLRYIIIADESPFEIGEALMDGDKKIKNFAKAFWSPLLQARFPDVLPNWNNKTENCLRVLGVNLKSGGGLSSETYRKISEAFSYIKELFPQYDFHDINHLMHYVTAVEEGKALVARLQNRQISDPITEMISRYKKMIKGTKLHDELYKWRLIKKYRGRPDLKSSDFTQEVTSIDLSNLVFYNAVKVRDHIVSEEPEAFRSTLRKLFDDEKELSNRVRGFLDEIELIYRRLENEYTHHHDERTISVYLTFYRPDKYALFKDSYYREYCKLIGEEPKKKGDKYVHYMELVKNLTSLYISRDEELISIVNDIADTECYTDPNHLLLAQDILYETFDKGKGLTEAAVQYEAERFDKPEKHSVSPLNTILYGPPGTGKTYTTIDHAVRIAAPDSYTEKDHESNKKVYDVLVKDGQIVFTTFHQSLCYEDFIEGIKPSADGGSMITYSVEDGIFKQMAINAAFEFVSETDSDASRSLDFSYVYDKLLDEVSEAIGGDDHYKLQLKAGSEIEIIDITSATNFLIQHMNGSRTYTVSRKRLEKLYLDLPALDEISNINEEIRKVIGGSNASAYWAVLKKLRSYNSGLRLPVQGKTYSYEEKAAAVEKLLPEEIVFTGREKAYILVVDEINRGNVSQIFGELITLIEEDKRYGNQEGLSCLLPYSRTRFFVPPNLYIIGTMNTADRSVEALDTALRRRFSFQEMMPDYGLQGVNKEIGGFDLSQVLSTINRRIEKLYDRDHQIGHSYLLKINSTGDLMRVFRDSIIPLLQEYFYGNYEKMGLVLGSGFIEKQKEDKVRFAKFTSDDQEYYERNIFNIKRESLEKEQQFLEALGELMASSNGDEI